MHEICNRDIVVDYMCLNETNLRLCLTEICWLRFKICFSLVQWNFPFVRTKIITCLCVVYRRKKSAVQRSLTLHFCLLLATGQLLSVSDFICKIDLTKTILCHNKYCGVNSSHGVDMNCGVNLCCEFVTCLQ